MAELPMDIEGVSSPHLLKGAKVMKTTLILTTVIFLLSFSECYEYFSDWEIGDTHVDSEKNYDPSLEPFELPKFSHEAAVANVSVKKGSNAFLHCKVTGLGDQSVSWYKRQRENIQLITFGFQTYHNDARFSLTFVHPNDWRLRISDVKNIDEGTYECQVSTYPPIIRTINLHVVVPTIKLLDDRGVVLREKFYKTGSTIVLICEVKNVPTRKNIQLLWHQGRRRMNYDDPRGGVSVKTEIRGTAAKSWLRIGNALPEDSGVYYCAISGLRPVAAHIHVVQDEFPAAIQGSTQAQYSIILIVGGTTIEILHSLITGFPSIR